MPSLTTPRAAIATATTATAPIAPAGIASVAAALPERVVANDAIGARLGVDSDWIQSRTGIVERRHAAPEVTLTDIAADAAQAALARAGVDARDVDLILLATSTPDARVPNAAPLVAERLGALAAGAIDVGAACTGFLSALDLAAAAIGSDRYRVVLVIGAELMSRVLDLDDRRTAGLFGDGAGAVVVTPGGAGEIGAVRLRADGVGGDAIVATQAENVVRMDGRKTFRHAVARLAEVTSEVAADAGLGLDEIDLFVYHQANGRILSAVGERLGLDPDLVVDSISNHGNTSAASVPIALDGAVAAGRIGPGSRVFLGAFGAGFTWGGGLIEWKRG